MPQTGIRPTANSTFALAISAMLVSLGFVAGLASTDRPQLHPAYSLFPGGQAAPRGKITCPRTGEPFYGIPRAGVIHYSSMSLAQQLAVDEYCTTRLL